MARIIGIAGSLRAGSYNAQLLKAAAALCPAGSTVEIGSIREIPLYDGDVEAASGIPASVDALKQLIVSGDALLLVTPEYNNSIPGVFKNAIDWLSRPASDIARVFGDRPVGIMGASPGRFGTLLAQNAWLPVLRTLGTRAWSGPRVAVGSAKDVFDASGKIQDERVEKQVREFMAGFATFADGAR